MSTSKDEALDIGRALGNFNSAQDRAATASSPAHNTDPIPLDRDLDMQGNEIINAAGITGTQGPTGPSGPQGEAGPQGPAGADGVGVPAGGTSGQVLEKASGTDFDTQWSNPALPLWGGINGTLSDQADLKALLDSKLDDDTWHTHDLTNSFYDMYMGTVQSLGTNGEAKMLYQKIGRKVEGWITVAADSDHQLGAVGPCFIPGTELPHAPLATPPILAGGMIPMAFAQGFGYATTVQSSPGANDGIILPLGPAISYIPNPAFLWVQMTGQQQDGEIGNVWFATGNGLTYDFSGKQFSIHSKIDYVTEV